MLPTVKTTNQQVRDLKLLADLYGIDLEYVNAMGEKCGAAPESAIRILQLLGAPINSLSEAASAIEHGRQVHWHQMLEPVTVNWLSTQSKASLRVAQKRPRSAELHLKLEQGKLHSGKFEFSDLPIMNSEKVSGVTYDLMELELPVSLPAGYHELVIECGAESSSTQIIAAPRRAYSDERGQRVKDWGVFLPLYALHSSRSWGAGDFSDLAQLAESVGSSGGNVIGTLPLLAAFLDEPFEPSPYSPASRLFWNEFYINVEAVPELAHCEAAQAIMRVPGFAQEIAELRSNDLVDYRRLIKVKRQILELLAKTWSQSEGPRQLAFEQFLQRRPDVLDYARFRAVGEKYRQPWQDWPQPQRNGILGKSDFADADVQYHLYVQWIADEQLRGLKRSLGASGVRLYLDLPLGVNANSYDAWREREAFALGAHGGCPPDAVFPNGQDWGFPPMHPRGIREQRYRYVVHFLRHQLEVAGMLRIDHMPVFHRLYWIPDGMEARDGVYVRYPAEELYAIFSIESHRHQVALVGEDLGTLPPEVPKAMVEHGVNQMYVAQYAIQPDPKKALPDVPYYSVASLNTHDMPPFAAFLEGEDIRLREALGLLGELNPEKEAEHRSAIVAALVEFLRISGQLCDESDPGEVMRACLDYLMASPSHTVLVNLEDLWLETLPQNVPGTKDSNPNWRRKAKRSLPEIAKTLQDLNLQRTPTPISRYR